jgi:hypothetical protein
MQHKSREPIIYYMTDDLDSTDKAFFEEAMSSLPNLLRQAPVSRGLMIITLINKI